jgi:hypothetical protein
MTLFESQLRVNVLKRFIVIADVCRNMNCFNPLFEIVVGLNLSPLTRLTAMWSLLSPKYQEIFHSLSDFISAVCRRMSKVDVCASLCVYDLGLWG